MKKKNLVSDDQGELRDDSQNSNQPSSQANAANPSSEGSKEEKQVRTSIHFFQRSGGPQPTTLDPQAVNHFFIRNYSKVWAMMLGYSCRFKGYEDGTILFDIISDPRCHDHPFLLSRYIAREYKSKVNLLANATGFMANHYVANDIIGYNLPPEEYHLLDEMNARMAKAHSELSEKPNYIHRGSLG